MSGLEAVQPFDQGAELGEQGLELLVLDPVAPLELADDQFRVEPKLQVSRAALERRLDRSNRAVILGDIVGGRTDRIAPGVKLDPVGVAEDSPVSGGTGIATRCPVGVSDEVHVGERSGAPYTSDTTRSGDPPMTQLFVHGTTGE